MRLLLLSAGLVGGWLCGVVIGYLVVGLVSASTGGTPPDLTVPLLTGILGAGIGIAIVGRSVR